MVPGIPAKKSAPAKPCSAQNLATCAQGTPHSTYTDNSFINLLSIIANKNHSEDTRLFALDWIKKMYSDFIFYIHEPTNVEELSNHKMIQDAQNWWQINKRTPDVLNKIVEINKVSSDN